MRPAIEPEMEGPRFSLTEARGLVSDLFAPKEWIYWADFLPTILVGHACFALTRFLFERQIQPEWLGWLLVAAAYAVQCACYYRAVSFMHEVVHLPEQKLRGFRLAWHLLCGIIFFVPSFTYRTHLDHHRRRTFGTPEDGEYVRLASLSPWYIVLYLSQCLWLPPLALIRFGVLAPLTWVCPPLSRLIHQRASSLIMNPAYLRPLPTKRDLRQFRLEELACFLFLAGVVVYARLVHERWPIPYLIQGYATAVVIVLLNSMRTLASHRWWSDGRQSTFLEQMLDSVTIDSSSPLAVLIFPVGLRYHATHHLFPSMPYHNLRAAHQRLSERLPADSPYHRTVERSLYSVVFGLMKRAAMNSRRKQMTELAPSI
jgi:fatty acid desaturase